MAIRGSGAHEVRRLEQRPWRDPRVIVGLVLVLGSTILGSVLFAAQDDTDRYWSVRGDVTAGDAVGRDDLVLTSARLTGAAADHVIGADDELPARIGRLVWRRGVPAGTLLRPDDLGPRRATQVVELPLTVALGAAPQDLARGQRVDVWLAADDGQGSGRARRLLAQVPIVAVGRAGTIDGSAARTVVVDAGPSEPSADVVDGAASGRVTLVRRAGPASP